MPKIRKTKQQLAEELHRAMLTVRDALVRADVLVGWIYGSPNLDPFEKNPMINVAKEISNLLSNAIPEDYFDE